MQTAFCKHFKQAQGIILRKSNDKIQFYAVNTGKVRKIILPSIIKCKRTMYESGKRVTKSEIRERSEREMHSFSIIIITIYTCAG